MYSENTGITETISTTRITALPPRKLSPLMYIWCVLVVFYSHSMPYSSTEFVLQWKFPVCHTVNVTWASFQFEVKVDIAVVYCVFLPSGGFSASVNKGMSSTSGSPGLEKNILTQNNSSSFFSSCKSINHMIFQINLYINQKQNKLINVLRICKWLKLSLLLWLSICGGECRWVWLWIKGISGRGVICE